MFRNPIVRDFLTGLFALGAVAGLCALLMLFGEMSQLGVKHYRFRVVLPSAAGLGPTSPVNMNGVKVGQVESARVVPEGAELVIKVRQDVLIPSDAALSVERGLIGDASLEFIASADSPRAAPAPAIEANSTLRTKVSGSMFDRLAEAVQKPLDKLSASADTIEGLATTWKTTGERLNELLEKRSTADVEAGKPANIASTIARLDAALLAADRWMNDETLKAGVKDTLARAGAVLSDMQTFLQAWTGTADTVDLTVQKIDGVVTRVDTQVDRLAGEALQALRHVDEAAGELGKVLEATNSGEGTVGQLVKNPDLYRSMTASSQRLERVLEELQLLVEKLKAEGVKIKL